ncbi:MAG: UDP-N-acetylglucosamine 4,6-dehydratase, partial [bacterium]
VVGVSTDKACQPENIYGYSKKILEQMFLEHYTEQSRFVCTRFTNVACSSGSVIPFWIESAKKNKPLKLTDSRMNRLMFTQEDAAQLIRESIEFAELSTNPFIMCSRMKSVGMLDLANLISSDFGNGSKPLIVGLRPGEQLNEVLVSQRELPNAFYTRDGRYIILHSDEYGEKRVTEPLSSLTADYMSETQMRFLYSEYLELAVPSLSLAHSNR